MILIVDMNHKRNSLGFYEFVMPIVSIVSSAEKCKILHYLDVDENDIKNCNGVILSGTPLKDNEFTKNVEKFEWLKECEKPVLGICAGMQIIGLVFGSTLKKCKEIGMVEMETVRKNPLFSSKFKAYTLHNYTVEPSKEFEIIAKSDKCVQGIKHRKKEIYGLLFHPEVRNKEIIKQFIANQTKNTT